MTFTTLVIAVPGSLIQRGLSALVQEIPELSITGVVSDFDETMQALINEQPHLLVIDADLLSEAFSPSRTAQVLPSRPPRVLVLSPRAHIGTTLKAYSHCMCGFASERASWPQLHALLSVVARCPSEIGGALCGSCPVRPTLQLPKLPLTAREYRVFQRIGYGESTSGIAKALGVSVKTIESHRESIKRKLKLRSAAELQEAAVRWKWGEHLDTRAQPQR